MTIKDNVISSSEKYASTGAVFPSQIIKLIMKGSEACPSVLSLLYLTTKFKMPYKIKFIIPCFAIFLILMSCNQNTVNSRKEKELEQKENELVKKENELLKKELNSKHSTSSTNNLNTTNIICYPIIYNPKILSGSDPILVHPDWKGKVLENTWTIQLIETITNEKGIFIVGDLISPQNVKMDNGPYYVIFTEWSCSNK